MLSHILSMRALAIAFACVAVAAVSAAPADDFSVQFDEDVDFAAFRTFTVVPAQVRSERPELQFPAIATTLEAAVRSSLASRAMKETDRGDIVAWTRVICDDWVIGPWGYPSRTREGRGARAAAAVGITFTEATIVLDLKHGTTDALLWRGVYHDEERDPEKLAEALPKDIAKMLGSYPPRKR